MKLLRCAWIVLVLGLLSCGGSGGSGGGAAAAGGSGGSGGTSGSGGTAGAGNTTACDTLEAGFQTALAQVAKAPGATVAAVATEKCGLWQGASGQAAPGQAATPQHRVRLGSVTKTYISALTLKLVEQGKLSLDDTVDKWANGIPGGDSMTLRMLLNMTSGMYSYTDDPTFLSQALAGQAFTPEELLLISLSHPPVFSPGQRWHYSNTNTILLGLICEQVGGAPIAQQLRDQLLTPAKLSDTYFDGADTPAGTLAQGVGPAGEDYTNAWDPSAGWAAGAMVATAADAARWGHQLYRGKLLGAQMMLELFTVVPADDFWPGAGYGLAAIAFPKQAFGVDAIGHSGHIPGYQTWLLHIFDFDATIAVNVTADENPPDPILDALAAVLVKDAGL